jgi:tetratricopeptide (TPR) repeat protein
MRHMARLALRIAPWIVAVIGTATIVLPARADEPPPTKEGARPTKEAREEARARFNRGVELFEEQEYERALVEFERAYSLAPSVGVLYNLAQVNAQLHRYSKAIPLYERYLSEGGADLDEARVAEVERALAEARGRTAKLLVRVDQPAAEITLDDQPFATSPMAKAVMVDSGQHRIVVAKSGFRAATRTISLAGGDNSTIDLALEREAGERTVIVEKTSRAPIWIAWGATGALAIGTTVFGIAALNAGSDLEKLRGTEGSEATERSSTASRIKTFSVLADAFGAATLLSAGVALYFTLTYKPSTPNAASARLGVSPSSVHLVGTF